MGDQQQNADRWKDRAAYLARCLRDVLNPERHGCPNCGAAGSRSIHRKYLVTSLRRCGQCRLLFRVPTDRPAFTEEFYQQEYAAGFTTDCPDDAERERLKASRFHGSAKNFSLRIELLQALGVKPGMRVLDYGASWGYEPWQLLQAGYNVVGYELSRPRARYAREKMGVEVLDDTAKLVGPFDAFFSSHVLEHIPQVGKVLDLARRLIRPGGLFVALTPNGSAQAMADHPEAYHRAWGGVHPLYLDSEFYLRAFAERPILLASHPYDHDRLAAWDRSQSLTLELKGPELLAAVAL